ncbi:non-homologous end-joining factor 1-like isoform X4 [Tribolium madens]|uniref:non-homologous end-joining factor 1-like isoform X4 n=1 Tax=Tribolium madens TaxID=41895 RepID=UPI001CF7412F|nr:non-homologous end-joining factor 1-like isoform X4 [Tribolium madens]
MWKTFQHGANLYMIKVVQDTNLRLVLTDFQNIWVQEISKDDLLLQFQEANPLFDVKVDEIVTEVTEAINSISDLTDIEISEADEGLKLLLNSIKSEYKIKFKFNFHKSSSETFLKEITVPLIQTVKHLEERQNMLMNLLQKKDRELEEYKLEKGVISRDDLITEKFDEEKLNSIDDKSMMGVFGHNETFWNSFVSQHGNIEATIEDGNFW